MRNKWVAGVGRRSESELMFIFFPLLQLPVLVFHSSSGRNDIEQKPFFLSSCYSSRDQSQDRTHFLHFRKSDGGGGGGGLMFRHLLTHPLPRLKGVVCYDFLLFLTFSTIVFSFFLYISPFSLNLEQQHHDRPLRR